MRDSDGLDLHTLKCLNALMAERSVGRAAQRMGIGQSSMSKNLAKLRSSLEDPLFIRTGRGLVPTERAIQICEGVRGHLDGLQSVLDPENFNPAATIGQVSITTADTWLMLLLPQLLRKIRRVAPNLTVNTRYSDKVQIKEWLEDGLCDLAVGAMLADPGPAIHEKLLYTEKLVCMVANNHPRIRKFLSLEQYLEASHITMHCPASITRSADDAVDAGLAAQGLVRSIGARIHSSLAWGYVIAQNDLVATVGSRLAHHFASFLPVRALPLPLDVPEYRVCMLWHDRSHRSALQRWLREMVGQTLASPKAQESPYHSIVQKR